MQDYLPGWPLLATRYGAACILSPDNSIPFLVGMGRLCFPARTEGADMRLRTSPPPPAARDVTAFALPAVFICFLDGVTLALHSICLTRAGLDVWFTAHSAPHQS
jgi:hypothetical protein